jgi:hypothetical protein
MRVVHTFFYTSLFYASLLILALFSGVQITLPAPEQAARQAQIDDAKQVLASSVFDAVEPRRKK